MNQFFKLIEDFRNHMRNLWALNKFLEDIPDETTFSESQDPDFLSLKEKCVATGLLLDSTGAEVLNRIRSEVSIGLLNKPVARDKEHYKTTLEGKLALLEKDFNTLFHNKNISTRSLNLPFTLPSGNQNGTESTTVYSLVTDVELKLKAFRYTISQELEIITVSTQIEQDSDENIDLTKPLSGKWNKIKIMTDQDYKRLVEYIRHVISTNTLPSKIDPVKKGFSNISQAFYTRTIYLIWKANKENTSRKIWVTFLKTVFKDVFKNSSETTIRQKFATYEGSYDSDKIRITHD